MGKEFLRLRQMVCEEKRGNSKKKKPKYGDYGFVSVPIIHSHIQSREFARRLKQKIFSDWN